MHTWVLQPNASVTNSGGGKDGRTRERSFFGSHGSRCGSAATAGLAGILGGSCGALVDLLEQGADLQDSSSYDLEAGPARRIRA